MRTRTKRSDGSLTVTKTLLAYVFKCPIHATGQLIAHLNGNNDLTRICQLSESSCDVDAIPGDVEVFDQNIGDVDTDAHAKGPCPRLRVQFRKNIEKLESASERLSCIWKFGHQAML